MKSNPSETTTAYFSVHVTCPTVYRVQIVSKAVCPTWCTYLYQEQEKSRPPLENSSRSPLRLTNSHTLNLDMLSHQNHLLWFSDRRQFLPKLCISFRRNKRSVRISEAMGQQVAVMPSGVIISIHKFKIEQNNTHCSYMSFVASVITLVLNINNNINANNNNNNQVLYLVFCIIIDYKQKCILMIIQYQANINFGNNNNLVSNLNQNVGNNFNLMFPPGRKRRRRHARTSLDEIFEKVFKKPICKLF